MAVARLHARFNFDGCLREAALVLCSARPCCPRRLLHSTSGLDDQEIHAIAAGCLPFVRATPLLPHRRSYHVQ